MTIGETPLKGKLSKNNPSLVSQQIAVTRARISFPVELLVGQT